MTNIKKADNKKKIFDNLTDTFNKKNQKTTGI